MNDAAWLLVDLVDQFNMHHDEQLRWRSQPDSKPMGAVGEIRTPENVVYRVELTRIN